MHFTLKKNPIKDEDLDDFVKCYNPDNRYDRKETWSEENINGRWRKFTYDEIKKNNYNLDIKWIKDSNDIDEMSVEDVFDKIKSDITNINNVINKLELLIRGEEDE